MGRPRGKAGERVCPDTHRHGNSVYCYRQHKCRCGPCTLANTAAQEKYRKQLAYGRHRGFVPSHGVTRRIQALAYAGWSTNELSTRLGMDRTGVWTLMKSERTTPKVYDRITDLYDELWDQPPPARTPGERGIVTRTKRWARRSGFAPALAWDDETIDDPEATPNMGERTQADRDLEAAEHRAQVALLTAFGHSTAQIAKRLEVAERTVTRLRKDTAA